MFILFYYYLFIYFRLYPVSRGILVPRPGIEPLQWKRSLTHWTAREVSVLHSFIWLNNIPEYSKQKVEEGGIRSLCLS